MIYTLSYDGDIIARVEITDSIASQRALREMVEFWAGWENRLEQADGDYMSVWLTMLARYLILEGKAPRDEEGWVPLDGTRHIWLRDAWAWEPNNKLIHIEGEMT